MRPTAKAMTLIVAFGLSASPAAAKSPDNAEYGSLTIGPTGINNFLWQINNATGNFLGPGYVDSQGNVSGWSEMEVIIATDPSHHTSTGDLTWVASSAAGSQFSFALETLLNPTPVGRDNPGPMADFDPTKMYVWPIIVYHGTYNGPTDSTTLSAGTQFDTSQFLNPIDGVFTLALDQNPGSNGGAIDLVYTPVPEPGTLALVAVGLLGVWRARRRRSP